MNFYTAASITMVGREDCHYHLDNPWDQPLGRISEFLRPIQLDPQSYRLVQDARIVGGDLVALDRMHRIVAESIYLRTPSRRQANSLRLRSLLPPAERLRGAVCSLVSGNRWHLGFYHWFMDCLPKLIAAEDHAQRTGSCARVIVPSPLKAWQEHSLDLLGIGLERRISDQPHRGGGLAVDLLIEYVGHRWQRLGDAPFDAISPWAFRHFAEALGAKVQPLPTGTPKRLYLTRRGVPTRQITNEDEVMGVLEPHGFVMIQCDSLSLSEQIALFRDATHIVSPHGASLTNLLHVQQASVLEIFQAGHGVRPDFFQLAMIKGLDYQHCVCATESTEFHCRVPPELLRHFLERTL